MLENAMPGEAILSNGVLAEHHLKQQASSQNALPNKALQEMAAKLEKSESGRRKLRQAISMLKEKVEANEKVLQVNEILRQECEKERLRAEAERNRAKEEKRLRELVEKEGLSTKEQLVRVLQRLDAVERNCKADRDEIMRLRTEMKEAVSVSGEAVKALEAAHSSLDSIAAAPNAIVPSQGTDINAENVSGGALNGGWDSDSEMSEDEFGEDWWTEKRVLLSPSLPEVPPPSLRLWEPDSNAASSWPASSEMNVEDISLFLDVLPLIDQDVLPRIDQDFLPLIDQDVLPLIDQDFLPLIDQDVCGEGGTVAPLPHVVGSKSEIEELHIQSGLAARDGEHSKELQPGLATESFGHLHKRRKRSTSNDFVQCFQSGSELPEKPDDFVKDEKLEGVSAGYSTCNCPVGSESRPEPSFDPHDVIVVAVEKSEGVDDRLMVDSGARVDDIFQGSKVAVKEEKVDAVKCAAMEQLEKISPYSVELVMGGSGVVGVNCTGSAMLQECLGSTTSISDKIMEVFGRIRKVLHGALSDTSYDAFERSLTVATEIASFFVSSTLSKAYLMCIFIASLVDSHALWNNDTRSCLGSESKSLQLLIDIGKEVLGTEVFQNMLSPDQAFLIFAVQLQNFLIQGTIQPQIPEEDARDEGCTIEQCFHFTTPSSKPKRLEALISGGKLLAVLCVTIGKLDFLRNSVFRVLRFSDMDSECLLASISSFAFAGYKSLFSVDKDDVVGQAVQVVISELIHDAEVKRQVEPSSAKREDIECEMEIQQGSFTRPEESSDCTELFHNFRALREVIGEKDDLSFEGFVPRLLELFHGVMTATPGSHLRDNRHFVQRSLRMLACNEIKSKRLIDSDPVKSKQRFKTCEQTDMTCTDVNGLPLHIGEKDDDRIPIGNSCGRYVTDKSTIQLKSQSERDADLVEEWEQKFYDITNALELVASHLGWEWTYNDIIVEHLWKLVYPGAPSMTVACVAHMFGLLGRLGREVDSTELPGVAELRKSLLVVVSSDQTSSAFSEGSKPKFLFRAQVAAAQALLVLSNFNRKDEVIPSKDSSGVFLKSRLIGFRL